MENTAPERFVPIFDRTEVTYKKQGNGEDSWEVEYYLNDELVHKEMVFKDPSKPDTEQAEKIVEVITPELLSSLWDKMIDNLTPKQIDALKSKLKL